jgi:type II pantothenate kinase
VPDLIKDIPPATIGIDAGATLCKVARGGAGLETLAFDSGDLAGVQRTLAEWKPERILATGGGAAGLGERVAGAPVRRVPEFEAWAHGAPLLARLEGIDLPASYLLVSLGTGTSIMQISPRGSRRVGGSALGGGSLLGLGRLLLGLESFDDIAALAERGDRRKVDLLVGDIYAEGELPLPAELNAASFGKLQSRQPADLAHALMGLVGENVGLICGQLAQALEAEAVVYCGSTLTRNPTLSGILRGVGAAFGTPAHLLEHGAFCGAIGAASLAER